jgi:hypothetical protein
VPSANHANDLPQDNFPGVVMQMHQIGLQFRKWLQLQHQTAIFHGDGRFAVERAFKLSGVCGQIV